MRKLNDKTFEWLIRLGALLLVPCIGLLLVGDRTSLVIFTGFMTMTFLMLCLAMTPLYIIWGNNAGLSFKRPYGLITFVYSLLHGLAYLWKQDFALAALFDNGFIVTGVIAFLILLPLAITSNDRAMKRLGRNWKHLQRLTYLVTILAAFHTVSRGLSLGIILILLLAIRLPSVRGYFVHRRQNQDRPKREPVAA